MSLLGRAIELAERGRGTTHPNPVVGAVVERDGEVVAEGWHERAGEAHAEAAALAVAGERAAGGTLYVSLEPCSHHGTTPPCTDAVLAAGIARVVVGALDPNPEVDGVSALRAAGVDVEVVDSFEARRPERGVADVDPRRAAVRDLQGGHDPRRQGHRSGCPLGDR